ncbi:MAG: hypothetical protein EBW74_03610 [Betaproteobacteria bacterium]|nr:hypothetical protein [Betaproteobacteria bacterium]
MAQMQPQQQPQQTQQMRTGGAVRAANGLPDDVSKFFDYTGAVSVPPPPAAGMPRPAGLPRVTSPMPAFNLSEIEALAGPARGTGAILSEIRGVRGESPLIALSEQLKQREEQVRGQRQSLGETLMRLGLGMAASRRPDFLGAVGEGGLSALQGYVQNRDFTRKEAADLLRQRMAVEAQRQQSDDVLFREAGDLARAEQYGRVSTIQAIQAARNTALTANTAAEREEARNRANALIAQYEAGLRRALERLEETLAPPQARVRLAEAYQALVVLAQIPEHIRGFGHVKERHFKDAQARWKQSVERFDQAFAEDPPQDPNNTSIASNHQVKEQVVELHRHRESVVTRAG